jgi:diguanylate cyclase (GGDEF)-like protein
MASEKNPITQFIQDGNFERIKRFDSIFDGANIKIDNTQKEAIATIFKKFSVLALPIKKDHHLFGVLVVVSPRNDILETEKNFLSLFAHQIEIGVTIADLFETIKKQAVTDALTGLYNRRQFDYCILKESERALRQKQPFSLITLDLDHLKYINDTFGHAIGDVAISTIAKVLKEKARAIDIAARFGGEEFGVILPGVDSQRAMVAAERIRAAIEAEPIPQVKKITASVGVVTFGEHTENVDELLEMADKAMYNAKKSGRNQVKIAQKEDKQNWLDIALSTFIEIIDNNKKANLDKTLLENLKMISTKEKGAAEKIFTIVDKVVKNYDPMHAEGTTKHKIAYAIKLGQEVQLDSEEIDKIKLGVLLYDLGNLLLPDSILLKPGPLSDKEKKLICEHPTMAVKQILKPINKVDEILPMIQAHHERWDGTGYPQKLSGESIPIGARIIVVLDAYFALISDRPYRLAYTKKETIDILLEGANTQWDGRIVEIFVQILQREEE